MRFLLICILLLCIGVKEDKNAQSEFLSSFTTAFVVFPADCNALGTLFGGKILGEMDRTAAITVRRFLYASGVTQDAVTLSIENVTFKKPGKVKDLVFITGKVTKVGKKTITVSVTVEKEVSSSLREELTSSIFVFCAVDKDKKSIEHGVK
jgi:acyl-CoA hydrolase